MSKRYTKSGYQSADDPFTFIMSTDTQDRYDDVVVQNWNLTHFRKNPIALFGHDHSKPIGTWSNVRVVDGKLIGKLTLAKQGTSEIVDAVRQLLEQRILKAVSVGFNSNYYEALNPEKPWGGYRLDDNELLECSVVSVGANQDALLQAVKSMNLGSSTRKLLRQIEKDSKTTFQQSSNSRLARVSDKGQSTKHSKKEKLMSLSDKIKGLQKSIAASRAEMDDIEKIASNEERDLSDDEIEQMDLLAEDIEKAISQKEKLERIEQSRSQRIKDAADEETASSNNDTNDKPARNSSARVRSGSSRTKGHRAMATMATMLRSFVENRNPLDVAKAHYSDESEIVMLAKAAVAPASTGTADWAGDLVRETWGEFIDLIRDKSIYLSVPGFRLDFDRYGKLSLPKNTGRGKLAGGYVAEGGAIPVKKGSFGNVPMTPKSMKVISTFTKELANRSNPAIEGMIQSQILGDTAESIDAVFMGSGARTTISPSGIQDATETGAANIKTSAGATIANINADTKGMLSRVITERISSGVWVMNPLVVLSLMDKQDAASGEFVYRGELQNGKFRGHPYISSANCPVTVVAFIGEDVMAFANDYAPNIEVSTEATLHMEDTLPASLVTEGTGIDGATAVEDVANPVMSMFQTDSVALKMTMGLDNRQVRANGIQVLDGVNW